MEANSISQKEDRLCSVDVALWWQWDIHEKVLNIKLEHLREAPFSAGTTVWLPNATKLCVLYGSSPGGTTGKCYQALGA